MHSEVGIFLLCIGNSNLGVLYGIFYVGFWKIVLSGSDDCDLSEQKEHSSTNSGVILVHLSSHA